MNSDLENTTRRSSTGSDPVVSGRQSEEETSSSSRSGPDPNNPIFQKALKLLRQQSPLRPAIAESPADAVADSPKSLTEPPNPLPNAELPTAPAIADRKHDDNPIPARMLNEFVYCQRLFYYEFVEGVFVENADTLRGGAIHQRVDSGTGSMLKAGQAAGPETSESTTAETQDVANLTAAEGGPTAMQKPKVENDIVHSRSVQMGSERLGVVAKMDLVEVKREKDDLFTASEVCPVDYKAGAPKKGEDANELWDTDKMQLGLQALILRDNGYACNEGIIYYHSHPIGNRKKCWKVC